MSELNLDNLLELNPQELKAQIIRGGGGGKTSAWKTLNEDQIKMVHRKILANLAVASHFAAGKTEKAQFFAISDVPSNEKTAFIHRNQQVSFQKSGQVVNDVVIGFQQTGTNVKLSYKDDAGNDVVFRASGLSVVTKDNGSKSIESCAFTPIEEMKSASAKK